MRVCGGIHHEIGSGLLRELPVFACLRIKQQLSLVVTAVRVKKEISVSRKECTTKCVRTIERAF
jgi:hypothetical protein